MNILKQAIFLILFFTSYGVSNAQRTREIQDQNHFWWSINTNAKITPKWSFIADLHIRRTDFLKNNNFFYTRLGAGYNITNQLSVSLSGGHMWLANRNAATELFLNENRMVEQVQYNSSIGKVAISNRLRIEQRWLQKLANNIPAGDYRFSNRYRYQLALNIQLGNNKKIPSVAVANELMVQTGKDIVYNHFDQNRFFIGIKQQISPSLSFDFGYMRVWQQKLSGYQYSRNHTVRWFFFWQPDWSRKNKQGKATTVDIADHQ
jgi:hypothetical protein